MKKTILFFMVFGWIFIMTGQAIAHFGMIIPSDQMVMKGKNSTIKLDLLFWHPFEGIGMDLAKPIKFSVMNDGKTTDLLDKLKQAKTKERQTWTLEYKITKPGVYMFYMEPQPYWEPAEDIYVIHYTKVAVAALGNDEGWENELGLKTEIVPLSKPYGLYAGNVFQGIVKVDGKPVPYAHVEVEYYNKDGKYKAPSDYMTAQTIKADGNGVFTYAAPKAGWWGFAALSTSNAKIKHDGQDKDVEIGAVIWVQFHEMQ